MARKNSSGSASVADYRYDAKRKNIPEAGLESQGRIEEKPRLRYAYDPHLAPVLRFDPTGNADRLPELLDIATHRTLTADEARLLAEALRNHQPWLEWSGKQEAREFEVDPVALHIHERVATKAILAAAARQDIQRSLFADDDLGYRERVQFYRHDVDWANRLILGDSLQVMASLAGREAMAGKVQMIYVDPPYGIGYRSNFQPSVSNKDVKDRPEDLTREPEAIQAYRDTWRLGVHTYLGYLRDRLCMAHRLLADTGSIFVQISDENVHGVRAILDEIFGRDNFVSLISFQTSVPLGAKYLPGVTNYLLWYARDRNLFKFRRVFQEKPIGQGGAYNYVELSSGLRRAMTARERETPDLLPRDAKPFFSLSLLSAGTTPSCVFPISKYGTVFQPGGGRSWKTNPEGVDRLAGAERIFISGNTPRYVLFHTDYSVAELTDLWSDTSSASDKRYVVQTAEKVVERCLLMTTDPGDLVLDPTSGSGTTAVVAEKWGRRWIAVDTSRVANTIARQRLLTSVFDWYELRDPIAGVDKGLVLKTVPHVTLKSIAQNQALDIVFARHQPLLTQRLAQLNAALGNVPSELRSMLAAKLEAMRKAEGVRAITEAERRRWLLPEERWEEWNVPFDADPDWPADLQEALAAYRQAWREKMAEVNDVIARSAEKEDLVDQPVRVPGISRVSGPFTVESVLPLEQAIDQEPSPVAGWDEGLETFGDDQGATIVPIDDDPQNAEAFVARMTDLLRKDGARFLGNKTVGFDRLEPSSGSVIHAEGVWRLDGEREREVAVSFGPQYGNITALQVEQALRTANRRGFDDLLLAGFGFDDAAQAAIQDDENPRVRCHMTLIRPDVLMGDLLKTTANSQIFTVVAMPRARLNDLPGGELTVTMEGMDVYDPVENVLRSTGADKVAAWFLDSDYDGRTFCICQAFFPDPKAWDKLARALKGAIDEEAFAAFSGDTSLPFRAGEHGRVCVKVIDPRGNEATRVLSLSEADTYAAMAGAGSGRP